MSVDGGTVEGMDFDSCVTQAITLGQDHAEDDHHGVEATRLYAGRQVAAVLNISEELSGDQYVRLREAYEDGWSSWQ